jgi:hypothetical protein
MAKHTIQFITSTLKSHYTYEIYILIIVKKCQSRVLIILKSNGLLTCKISTTEEITTELETMGHKGTKMHTQL